MACRPQAGTPLLSLHMKPFVKVFGLAELVMVHDRYLYAGESRVCARGIAEQVLADNPGSIKIEELPDETVTEPQAVTIEETAPETAEAAADEAVSNDSGTSDPVGKPVKRGAVSKRKS
jgi:hypothetical protein